MNCRDFQNEFEERLTLSQTATLHLDSCANCQKYHFEQTRLWEMLGGLKRVETPQDFNFQLKARIARAQPEDYRTGFFPALRYVLPLSFAVVLISFVAMSGLYFVDRKSISPVASEQNQNPPVNTGLPVNTLTQTNAVAGVSKPEEGVPVNNSVGNQAETANKKPDVAQKDEGGSKDFPNKTPDLISPGKKDPGGVSKDHALTPPIVLTPEGFNSNQKVEIPVNPNVTTTDIKSSLEMSGIKTNSLKVISVGKDSLAERSGIKIGDIIEEINGIKITGNTLSGQRIEVKTLTVLRGGKSQVIVLRY